MEKLQEFGNELWEIGAQAVEIENPGCEHLPWHSLTVDGEMPEWTGHGFRVGGTMHPFLICITGTSGWNDNLAHMMAKMDQNRPIAIASQRHAVAEMRRALPANNFRPVLLEVGCCQGGTLRALRTAFPGAVLIGADYSSITLARLAVDLPSIPLIQLDIGVSPLPDGMFDGIVILNVLEHVKDDEAAIRHIYRMLRPGGVAVIEVPAGPNLYDAFDCQVGHFRRYRQAELTALVEACGFEILSRSHVGFLVYPPFWVKKKRNQYLAASSDLQQQAVVTDMVRSGNNRILKYIFRLEDMMRCLIPFPWGIRCTVTCRKV